MPRWRGCRRPARCSSPASTSMRSRSTSDRRRRQRTDRRCRAASAPAGRWRTARRVPIWTTLLAPLTDPASPWRHIAPARFSPMPIIAPARSGRPQAEFQAIWPTTRMRPRRCAARASAMAAFLKKGGTGEFRHRAGARCPKRRPRRHRNTARRGAPQTVRPRNECTQSPRRVAIVLAIALFTAAAASTTWSAAGSTAAARNPTCAASASR